MTPTKTCFVITGTGLSAKPTDSQVDPNHIFHTVIRPELVEMGILCLRESNMDTNAYERMHKCDFVVVDAPALPVHALKQLKLRQEIKPGSTLLFQQPEGQTETDIPTLRAIFRENFLKTVRGESADTLPPAVPIYRPSNHLSTETEEVEHLLQQAENAHQHHDFQEAVTLYQHILWYHADTLFLRQRLAYVTYKAALPNPKTALETAKDQLENLYREHGSHPETCGLLGAVNKRLYQLTADTQYLDHALTYYETGYTQHNDYYNGINAAYMYLLRSNTQTRAAAVENYANCTALWADMAKICVHITKSEDFEQRADKRWVYQTLAQAYYGLGNQTGYDEAGKKALQLSEGWADLHTFYEQKNALRLARERFHRLAAE